MDARPNPYVSPKLTADESSARSFRWRLVPAALFFVPGAINFAMGLLVTGTIAFQIWNRQPPATIGDLVAAFSLYIGIGASWMLAGRSYWKGSYRAGIAGTIVGIIIMVAAFSIMGF